MNTKIIFDIQPPSFWKDTILRIVGKAFLLILFFTFFYAFFYKEVDFFSVLKYSIFIMLIPIYKALTQGKDEIYRICITSDNNVLIKWNRWYIKTETSVAKKNISVTVEMHPFQRNGFFLKILFENGNSKNVIRQFSSFNWNVDLMRKVAKEFAL